MDLGRKMKDEDAVNLVRRAPMIAVLGGHDGDGEAICK